MCFAGEATDHLPFSLERQQILLVGRKVVASYESGVSTAQRELLVEQRYAHVEVRPQRLYTHTGLGQDCLSRIEPEPVLVVVRPRSRVEIEYDMVTPIVPVGQSLQP